MSQTFQALKNPPEYTMQYSVQPGRNIKNEAHSHLLGNEFHANRFQTFIPYNSQSVYLGTQLTLPKTPLPRTAPSWKHAFPGTPGMHMIELMIQNQNTHHKLTICT